MGADGGTIPKRCELVKKKKRKEKLDKNIANATRWRLCRLSQEPLKRPIVACRLGNLYNKEEILNAIISKKIGEYEVAKHIKSLKDVKELKLTDNKEYKESGADKGDIYKDHNIAPFCCPVTGISMNGNHSFTVNWRCGCVISGKAIEEVKPDVCHGCGGSFSKDDLILLNPPQDVLEIYKQVEEERLKRKLSKTTRLTEKKLSMTCELGIESTQKKEMVDDHRQTATSADFKGFLRKAEKRKATTAKSSSIQDSNASAAYKSLFTTCEEAKHKPEPHWITHNPLFY
ncbi:Rtf2 RING-finger family protein [Brugia pahangi]|uniref:Replication termination factor 2 n=1 Tax=Brugia pahangi TaxID=6280 RepID=A0A0N4SYS0_BRUPA|nr:unnamed protein product [Brugia pahangi]